jgi:hypothetical protein
MAEPNLELARRAIAELERIAGVEATITRFAHCSLLSGQHKDPDAAINELRPMFDLSKRMGLLSEDSSIPILDEPTLRAMLHLGWANLSAYKKHEKEVPPPVEFLNEARTLGERVFQGYRKILPVLSGSASNLVGVAHVLKGNLDEAESWFHITIQGPECPSNTADAKGCLQHIAKLRQSEVTS